MTLFGHVHIPSFAGATEWLNSEPLGTAELRGHVVLVSFLDMDVRQLAAPGAVRRCIRRTSRSSTMSRGRRATEERAIDYPVAVDNDYAIWSALANRYGPALYFVDADGVICDEHSGSSVA